MKKFYFFLILSMTLFLSASSAHARGGAVFNTIVSKYCSSQEYYYKTGCYGYYQLRIIHGNSRDKAKSNCHWNCNRLYGSNPTRKNSCDQGCNYGNSIDK